MADKIGRPSARAAAHGREHAASRGDDLDTRSREENIRIHRLARSVAVGMVGKVDAC